MCRAGEREVRRRESNLPCLGATTATTTLGARVRLTSAAGDSASRGSSPSRIILQNLLFYADDATRVVALKL